MKITVGSPYIKLGKDQKILYQNAIKSGEEYLQQLKSELKKMTDQNSETKKDDSSTN